MCVMTQPGTGETYTYPNTTSANSIYIAPKFQQVEYDITTGDNVTVNGQNSTTVRGGESLTFNGSTASRSECDRLDGQRQGSCR